MSDPGLRTRLARGTWVLTAALLAVAGFWLGRRSAPDPAGPGFRSAPTPHEAYRGRLEVAGLDAAALGRLWQRAARRAVAEAPRVDAPFQESGYLESARPDAVGYRFSARAGQQLRFDLGLVPATNALIFLDLFRAPGDSALAPVWVSSADSGEMSLVYEPDRDGEFIIRVQPELLRGGRYVLTATAEATMAFPVLDTGPGAVQSYFGDPRDGGRREHHGIDIFAPRGTPVVATTRARVRSVRVTPIGGRVVWLRDEERRQSIYYAHLEEQLVERGMEVQPGDTLGLVGNSGNARTTPPHLHFGIYRRGHGPMDPMPFVRPLATTPPAPFPADPGELRRVAGQEVRLRAGPGARALELGRLDEDVPVRVLSVAGSWLRVEIPDGRRGFVAGRFTEPASAMRSEAVATAAPLRESPSEESAEVARVERGEQVEVLGRLGDHLYVRTRGRAAWLATSPPE
ncbi:MAG TPA: peptidoglycan DD-metalloendopeptidase family protein [Longimicrobiales bacterium]|nr:peptidoglycan DD-metalloendopeptidase family protein [Longimicrobiales bacterium]